MKRSVESTITFILMLLFFPIILLFMLFILIATPFDYLKYKRTRYYKDTKEKYSLFCATSYYIKLYDLIKEENLPIDYYRYNNGSFITGYGFFVYKDILILSGYVLCHDEEKNIWLVETDDEYVDIKDDVEDEIKACNDFLKKEVCKRAVVLIDEDDFNEHPELKYDNIEILPIINGSYKNAIETILQQEQGR